LNSKFEHKILKRKLKRKNKQINLKRTKQKICLIFCV
jgi:hypothetical protein